METPYILQWFLSSLKNVFTNLNLSPTFHNSFLFFIVKMEVGGFKPWMSPLETLEGTNQLSFKALDITTFQIPALNCSQQIKLPRNIRYGTIKEFNDHQISFFDK